MDSIDFQDEFLGLMQEVVVGSVSEHGMQVSEFFSIYSELSAENGDTPDLEYCPVLGLAPASYRIDGYALDMTEGAGGELGVLYLAVCDFRQEESLPTLHAKEVDRLVDQAVRFVRLTRQPSYLEMLEEASPAFQLAVLIDQYRERINSVRVIVFSNAQLKTRRNLFAERDVDGVAVHTNVLDLERYAKISLSGNEPLEINFAEDFGGGIKCLSPDNGTKTYTSHLFSLGGDVLADIYGRYGNRLLEQNVRTYLQARTNVNKGILETIQNSPEMFFAYNNGITATASSVELVELESGDTAISSINDFQIVNGGQTTASMLYARDGLKRDLNAVHVQVKLSVVDEDRRATIVPKISEYANTQNKVSLADLASNSPAQVKIQRLSKEVAPPVEVGHLHASKWFYERSRGQYKSLFSYKSVAERRRLTLEYPREKLITKTDLAKYELSYAGEPHIVSLGAQKCFLSYVEVLKKLAGKDGGTELNAEWYKCAVSKAMLFRELDRAVQSSDWYKLDRGYKAQIVTYTIAACADGFRREGMHIDLENIWASQRVPSEFLHWMLGEAELVSSILKSPPSGVRNISEYAKKIGCWNSVMKGEAGHPTEKAKVYGVTIKAAANLRDAAKRQDKRDVDLDFDVGLVELVKKAHQLKSDIEQSGLASPKNQSAVAKLMNGNINLNRGEKNALKNVLSRLEHQ